MEAADLNVGLKDFGRRFIDAMVAGTPAQGAEFMLSYDEYCALTGDLSVSAADHEAAAAKQFQAFLKKHRDFIERHRDRLRNGVIDRVSTHRLKESQRSGGFDIADVQIVSLGLEPLTLANGDISSLYVQIDDAMLVDGSLRVRHFEFVRVGESIDDTSKNLEPLATFGINKLDRADFFEIMKGERWAAKDVDPDRWLIADGDLTIDAKLVTLLKGHCLLVTGNLTAVGLLNFDSLPSLPGLVVLGDVTAPSLMLTDVNCYFKGTTNVTDVLWVFGEGPSVTIAQAKGKFVFSASDGADIGVSPDDVDACINWSTGREFGDLVAVLGPELCVRSSEQLPSSGRQWPWKKPQRDDGPVTVDEMALYSFLVSGKRLGSPRSHAG